MATTARNRMRRFAQDLGNWRIRDDVPEALREEVDEFVAALDQGLNAMESQVQSRASTLMGKKSQLGEAIRRLQKNRVGMRKYRGDIGRSRLLDSEA